MSSIFLQTMERPQQCSNSQLTLFQGGASSTEATIHSQEFRDDQYTVTSRSIIRGVSSCCPGGDRDSYTAERSEAS